MNNALPNLDTTVGARQAHHADVTRTSGTDDLARRARQTRILVDATRDFTDNQRPSARDIKGYKELFYQFADSLVPADRRLLSTLLARSVFTPRAVAIYLATDTLDVAIPFLLYSPVLNELDLKSIAAKKGERFASVIAKRSAPPAAAPAEPATDESGAQAAGDFPASTIEDATVGTTTVTRPAAPARSGAADLSGELMTLASAGGKLGRTLPRDSARAASPSEPGTARTAEAVSTILPERRFDRMPQRETQQLIKLARNRKMEALGVAVSSLTGLSPSVFQSLVRSEGGDEAVYLAKALGIEPPRDLQFLLLAAPRYGRSTSAYHAAKQLLGDLDTGICRMIFNEIGANFELPMPAGQVPLKPVPPVPLPEAERPDEPASDFTDAIRRRRESLHPEQPAEPRQRPAARQASQDAAQTARHAASHRDFRDLVNAEPMVVNFG